MSLMFDVPGPRAQRRNHVYELLTCVLLAGLTYLVLSRLASKGELSGAAWQPFSQWGLWRLLLQGLGNNVRAAVVGMLISVAAGCLLAIALLSQNKPMRLPARVFTEFFRSVPLLLLLYFVSLVLPNYGLKLSDFWFLIIALSLYNTAVIADLVRAGVLALPRGQSEAALALGMSKLRTMRLILLPQALRSMSPALVSQLVILFKGTALAFVLGGYLELLRSTTVIGQYYTRSLLQAQLVAALGFLIVNVALSSVAVAIERRERRRYGLRPATGGGELQAELTAADPAIPLAGSR